MSVARRAKWLVNYGQHADGKRAATNAAASLRRKGWYVVRSGGLLYIESAGAQPGVGLGKAEHTGPYAIAQTPPWATRARKP